MQGWDPTGQHQGVYQPQHPQYPQQHAQPSQEPQHLQHPQNLQHLQHAQSVQQSVGQPLQPQHHQQSQHHPQQQLGQQHEEQPSFFLPQHQRQQQHQQLQQQQLQQHQQHQQQVHQQHLHQHPSQHHGILQHQDPQRFYPFGDANHAMHSWNSPAYASNGVQDQTLLNSLSQGNNHGNIKMEFLPATSDSRLPYGQSNNLDSDRLAQANGFSYRTASPANREYSFQLYDSQTPMPEFGRRHANQGATTDFGHHAIAANDSLAVDHAQEQYHDSPSTRMSQVYSPMPTTASRQSVAPPQFPPFQQTSFNSPLSAASTPSRANTPAGALGATMVHGSPYMSSYASPAIPRYGQPNASVPGYGQHPASVNATATVPAGTPPNAPAYVMAGATYPSPSFQTNAANSASLSPGTIQGCPNMSFSDTPTLTTSEAFKQGYDKAQGFVFKHNKNSGKVLPNRTRRLPGEIIRDYKALGSPNTNQTETRRKELKEELEAAAGDNAQAILSTAIDKWNSKDKGKTLNSTETVDLSDSDEEEEEDDEVDKKARQIMSAAVPENDFLRDIEQKVVRIVWEDPNAPPRQKATAIAIKDYGALIDQIWNKHKKSNTQRKEAIKKEEDAMKKLEGTKDAKIRAPTQRIAQAAAQEAAQAKEMLKRLSDMINIAVKTVNEFAADSILKNMGTYQRLTIILLNYVRYCYSNKDYNGPAPKSVLRLISKFTTLTSQFLGHLKLDMLRTKYQEDLDEESHGLLRIIIENANQYDKQQPPPEAQSQQPAETQGAKKTLKGPSSTVTPASTKSQPVKKELNQKNAAPDVKKIQPIKYAGLESARKVSNGTAAKRTRDDDVDTRSSKKIAVENTSGAPSATKQTSNAATPSTSTTTQSTPAVVSQRPKPSASILPGKSRSTTKPVARKAEPPKQETQKSLFGSLLEDIAKPKETPKPRGETQGPPETAEEKARRLRKESRRGKKVTWAPEDQLVQYRFFEHDPAEDEGRASSQLRDARDNRSEGQMLKSVMQGKKEKEDGEESDEDEDEMREIRIKDLGAPKESHRAFPDNLERRGGNRHAKTDQQKFMSDYESRELMSIYTTMSDLPDSPREPSQKVLAEPITRPSVCPAPNGPKAQETYRRVIESRQFNYRTATQQAIFRLPPTSNLPTSTQETSSVHATLPHVASQNRSEPRMMTQEERDAEILALLAFKKLAQWIDPDPFDAARPKTHRRHDYADPKTQAAADAIETVVEQLKGKPFPPTEPPNWLQDDPSRVKEWWTGHNANAAKMLGAGAGAGAGAVAYPTNLSASQQAPQPLSQPPQPQQSATMDITSLLQQVQAIQANQSPQLSVPSQQQQPTVQPQASGTTDIQALLRTLSQTAQPTQTQPQPQAQAPTDANAAANAAAWMAYFAQMQQPNAAYQQQQQQTTSSEYNADANAAQWAAYYQQQQNQGQQGQNQGQGQGQAENQTSYGQERQQNDSNDANGRRDRDRRANNNGSRPHGNNRGADRDGRAINRSLIGTKPCTFWAKNQCTKGDKCTFRHDPADLVTANY